jgi:flagellar basal-body rod protein FlgC
MDIISQNIANQGTYNTAKGEDPYCRQLVVFKEKKSFSDVLDNYAQKGRKSTHSRGVYYLNRGSHEGTGSGVTVKEVIDDETPFTPVYDPTNPHADENGYIYQTNVDNTEEQIDMLAAQRSYEANASAIEAVKNMLSKAMTLKGN